MGESSIRFAALPFEHSIILNPGFSTLSASTTCMSPRVAREMYFGRTCLVEHVPFRPSMFLMCYLQAGRDLPLGILSESCGKVSALRLSTIRTASEV